MILIFTENDAYCPFKYFTSLQPECDPRGSTHVALINAKTQLC